MINETLGILSQISFIEDIKELEGSKYVDLKFNGCIVEFNILIEKQKIGIVMAIPISWQRDLVQIFIENYEKFKFIPHVDKEGLVCLFDLEGILINPNFVGLINESIERLKKILIEGLEEANKLDFITEFDSYWNQYSLRGMVESSIKSVNKIKKIKYLYKYEMNDEQISLCAYDCEDNLTEIYNSRTIRNGIYINIESKEYIYPPDWRNKLDISYIDKILEINKVEFKQVKKLLKEIKDEFLLYININQPNGINTPIAILIKKYNYKLNNNIQYLKLNMGFKCIPLSVCRKDNEYLIKRCGMFEYTNKKILVVGCGSIGGYLVNELVKAGISNMCLVDKDILTTDNIYRHLLGMEFVGQFKTKALIKHINKNIPNIKIQSYEDNIEDLIEGYNLDFEAFDLIISATGDHNVNRWINKYIIDENVNVPIIYLWNEVLGIGNHALYINIKNKGCFECLIGKDENGIYDRTSYCERNQIFAKQFNGCHSTFIPFGSIHSLKTVVLGIELTIKYFNNELNENVLISQKGDDTYAKKEYIVVSDRYINQPNNICELSGNTFFNLECEVCLKRDKNGSSDVNRKI